MKTFTKDAALVAKSGRDDFDFHDPDAASIRKAFGAHIKLSKLGDVCISVGQGKTPAKDAYTDAGVRILKVKNVPGIGIRWGEKFYVSEAHYAKAKKAGVQEGDILMLCAAHNKEYIGRCDLVRDLAANIPGGKVCSVAELIIIRPNPKIILPEFLLTYVRMPMVLEEIIRMVKGQTAHLYPSDLRELEVVVPSLDVQRKIADAWTKAEADYIRRTREAQEDLERARKAAEAGIMAVEDSVQTNGTGAMPLFKGLHTRPG